MRSILDPPPPSPGAVLACLKQIEERKQKAARLASERKYEPSAEALGEANRIFRYLEAVRQ